MASSAKRTDTARHEIAPDIKGIADDSRAATFGILTSRITGFGRITVAAAVLGPTFFGNLFQTAAILPSTLYAVLIGSLISAVLVPPLVRRHNEQGKEGVRRLAGAVLGVILVLLLSISLLGILAVPVLAHVLTIAVKDPEIRRQQIAVGVPLLFMLLPQLLLYGVAGAGMAVQQAQGRFALAAMAPALENLTNIAVLGLSAFLFGVGTDLTHISTPQLLLLGLGTTTSAAVHAGAQWIGAYRAGVTLWPRFGFRDPDVYDVLRRGVASMGYTALTWATYLLLLIVAGTIPGGVVTVQLTASLCKFPVALSAIPLAAAQLPRLSTFHHAGDTQNFTRIYESGLRQLLFMAVPAALLAMAIPHTLAGAAAFGAMSSSYSIALIAACLGAQGIGIVGDAVFTMTTSACYARHDTATSLRAAGMRLAIVGVGAALVEVMAPPGVATMWVLGGSAGAASLVAGFYSSHRLRSALSAVSTEGSAIFSTIFISIIALIPALLLSNAFDSGSHWRTWGRMSFALGVLALTITLYLGIQFVRGARELRLLPIAGRWLPVAKRPAVNP